MFVFREPATKLLAATVAAALLLSAAPTRAQDAHGAIAFGKSSDGKNAAYGFAWNYASPDEARAAARKACSAAGGADCALLARFENGCGALAMDRYGRAQGKGALSEDQAKARAMRACKSGEEAGCAIVAAVCAEPGKKPRTWSGSDSIVTTPAAASRPAAAGQPRDAALTREDRIGVQRGLAALGFDAGLADGMFGPRTRSAIRAWQQAKGLAATGYLSRDEAQAIGAAVAGSGKRSALGEAPAQPGAAERLQPKCKGMAKGSKCWKELSLRPGCYLWDDYLVPDQTAAWTGACRGGTAHGPGTLLWSSSDLHSEYVGEMVRGRKQGTWTRRTYADRNDRTPFKGARLFYKGPYVDGKMRGRWLLQWDNGERFEGEIRDDKPNGFGTVVYPDGSKYEGQWRDGCFEGQDGKKIWLWTTEKACGFE